MNDSHRRTARLSLFLLVLLPLAVGMAHGQPPLYRIGAPYPPVRDPRLTTDNGIPGTGSYYYRDYPYPSLRDALQEYGCFGRRFRARAAAAGATDPSMLPPPRPLPPR
ncbi:MAG TPA: hypothetical protein VH643_19510 [Gemmataceae bacterium]|jgi:hypothetical protein